MKAKMLTYKEWIKQYPDIVRIFECTECNGTGGGCNDEFCNCEYCQCECCGGEGHTAHQEYIGVREREMAKLSLWTGEEDNDE
jgi:hypothetical protein